MLNYNYNNMENKYIDTDCLKNAATTAISEETMALIMCNAQLSGIYGTIYDVVLARYNKETDDLYPEFFEAFSTFRKELINLTADFMDNISLESNFTKI